MLNILLMCFNDLYFTMLTLICWGFFLIRDRITSDELEFFKKNYNTVIRLNNRLSHFGLISVQTSYKVEKHKEIKKKWWKISTKIDLFKYNDLKVKTVLTVCKEILLFPENSFKST